MLYLTYAACDMQLVLANPASEVIKKMYLSESIEDFGEEWIFPTVAEAVTACTFMLHTSKTSSNPGEASGEESSV